MARRELFVRVDVEGLKAEKDCRIVEKFTNNKTALGMIRASRPACNCRSATSGKSPISAMRYDADDGYFLRGLHSPAPGFGSKAQNAFAKNILQSESVFIMNGYFEQLHRQNRRLVCKMENGNSASRSGCVLSNHEVFEPGVDRNIDYLRNSSGGVHVPSLIVALGEIGLAA